MVRYLIIFALAGCATVNSDPAARRPIQIERAIVVADPAPTAESASAGYARLTSIGRDDRLLGGECACAGVFQIHRMVKEPKPDMLVDPSLALPADKLVEVRPGSDLHLWLADIRHPLTAGSSVTITLKFEKAGDVPVEFQIVADSRKAWEAMAKPE